MGLWACNYIFVVKNFCVTGCLSQWNYQVYHTSLSLWTVRNFVSASPSHFAKDFLKMLFLVSIK